MRFCASQYNGGEWSFVCGAHKFEKLFKITGTSLQKQCPVSLDNSSCVCNVSIYLLVHHFFFFHGQTK